MTLHLDQGVTAAEAIVSASKCIAYRPICDSKQTGYCEPAQLLVCFIGTRSCIVCFAAGKDSDKEIKFAQQKNVRPGSYLFELFFSVV
jgi:hypothetical protein